MRRQKKGVWNYMVLITQFGVSLIVPLLICVFVSLWIQSKFSTGYWVVIVGILLGISALINTFYRFYKAQCNDRTDHEKKNQYNKHQ